MGNIHIGFWSSKGAHFHRTIQNNLNQLSNGYRLFGSGGPLKRKRHKGLQLDIPTVTLDLGFVIHMDKASQSEGRSSKLKLWQLLAIPCSITLI